MSEEKKDILIEETDAGRHRRENPEPEPKKKKVSGWLIAVIAVVVVGIIAGLAVYFVQQKQNEDDVYVRTVSVTTDKETMTTTEEDLKIEDSDDVVISGDDAIGGDLVGGDTTTEGSWSWTTKSDEDSDDEEDSDSDSDDKTTKKTTKKTTRRRTTQWDPQQAAEDFWNEVSKCAR